MSDQTGGRREYALRSNGMGDGDGARRGRKAGPFHAVRRGDDVRAWIGSIEYPAIWPAGWKVRFDPTELLAPDGRLFAREGDVLKGGGGLVAAATAARFFEGHAPPACWSLTRIRRGAIRHR